MKTLDDDLELDLIESIESEPEEKVDQAQLKDSFYLNLTDFSIFKLRSIIYFTNFPITYTLAIITCWYKVIPETPNKLGGYL